MLVVTHEKNLVDHFSKRVIAIENGRITSDGTGGYYDHETI
jgi:cell division transport system ATP-binding protein